MWSEEKTVFSKTSKHLFIWRFWTVICFEQNMYVSQMWKHLNMWSSVILKESCGRSFVKHPNICSSGGFEQSNALSKTSYFSVVKTSKHLFIWRFWTVRCFEQNIYFSQVQKHLNIWSSVISKESCGHMEDYWWNIQTSIHLPVLNSRMLWLEHLDKKDVKTSIHL